MDFNFLPNELLKMVIAYLDKKDAKNLALASKRMRELTLKRLWSKPTYKEQKGLSFLKKISRFPIEELRIQDFECSREEIVKTFPHLKLLHADWNWNSYWSCKNILNSKVPLVVHTKLLKIHSKVEFDWLLKGVNAGYVTKLIINHEKKMRQWSPELLRKLVGKVYISEIYTTCLKFTEENVEEFCQIFFSLENVKINFPPGDDQVSWYYEPYQFTVEDIELFARYNVKVSFMSACALKNNSIMNWNLHHFVPTLKKMKHLESFEFASFNGALVEYPDVDLFVDLPVLKITTKQFRLEKGKIDEVAKTLSKIKSLRSFEITTNELNEYKFTPEEFALFKDLPVKKVHLEALELTKQNVRKFRQLMNKMKIEEIVETMTMAFFQNKKLGIRLRKHGPGGMYWSV